MKRSKNAHSSSDSRSRAKRLFIANTGLNHEQVVVKIPFCQHDLSQHVMLHKSCKVLPIRVIATFAQNLYSLTE